MNKWTLLGIALVILIFGTHSVPKIETTKVAPRFVAQNAFDDMKALSKQFPNRVPGNPNHAKAAEWIKQRLRALGYAAHEMPFSERIKDIRYDDLKNIWAEKRGSQTPNEIVLLLAHYDIAGTTKEGAMDDASGVGMVLELARVFAQENPQRTIVFLLTDAEEDGGLWGARTFAQEFERKNQIVAALSFDFVAPQKQVAIMPLYDGTQTGFTPLWLRELSLQSIRAVGGARAQDSTDITEYLQRAMQIGLADHGSLLHAGIPAVNWTGSTESFPYLMAHFHHTPQDKVENMRVESFADQGRAAEILVRTIDEMTQVPTESVNAKYFKPSETTYMSGWAVTLLQILAFVPFLFSLKKRVRGEWKIALRAESFAFVKVLTALLAGYGVMLLLPAAHILPYYELYPGAAKAAVTRRVPFVALILVGIAIFGVLKVLRKLFPDRPVKKSLVSSHQDILLIFSGIAFVAAFFWNSFAATFFLLPGLYAWIRPTSKRVLMVVAPFAVMVLVYTIMLTNPYMIFVHFLAGVYGLYSAFTMLLTCCVLAIAMRLWKQ